MSGLWPHGTFVTCCPGVAVALAFSEVCFCFLKRGLGRGAILCGTRTGSSSDMNWLYTLMKS